jgi:hypothetical protein
MLGVRLAAGGPAGVLLGAPGEDVMRGGTPASAAGAVVTSRFDVSTGRLVGWGWLTQQSAHHPDSAERADHFGGTGRGGLATPIID